MCHNCTKLWKLNTCLFAITLHSMNFIAWHKDLRSVVGFLRLRIIKLSHWADSHFPQQSAGWIYPASWSSLNSSDLDGWKWNVDIASHRQWPQRTGSIQTLTPVLQRWNSICLLSLLNRTTTAGRSSRFPHSWQWVPFLVWLPSWETVHPYFNLCPSRRWPQTEVQQLSWMPVSHLYWQNDPDYFN